MLHPSSPQVRIFSCCWQLNAVEVPRIGEWLFYFYCVLPSVPRHLITGMLKGFWSDLIFWNFTKIYWNIFQILPKATADILLEDLRVFLPLICWAFMGQKLWAKSGRLIHCQVRTSRSWTQCRKGSGQLLWLHGSNTPTLRKVKRALLRTRPRC